jgi:ATP-binding cassette subfamily F protein uup
LSRHEGTIRTADQLRIVYFDQNRGSIRTSRCRRALAPESDSVIYQDRVIHSRRTGQRRFLFFVGSTESAGGPAFPEANGHGY